MKVLIVYLLGVIGGTFSILIPFVNGNPWLIFPCIVITFLIAYKINSTIEKVEQDKIDKMLKGE